jgi:phage baseplate assembly protein W
MAKVFANEDGNLSNRPITTTVRRSYSDIDCSFEANEFSGDIYKKTDAAAVKQSVKNLLLTRRGEKPFNPYYGSGLYDIMFSLSTEVDEDDVSNYIRSAIGNNEPRVKLLDIKTLFSPDYNSADITVEFQVINTLETTTVTVTISRNR